MKNRFKFILVAILLNIKFIHLNRDNIAHNSHYCDIDKINIEIKYPFSSDKKNFIKRNLNNKDNNDEEFIPMRIYIDKTYLIYQKNNNPSINSIYSIINKSFDRCTSIITKLLKVKPLKNKINFITNEDLENWDFNSNGIDSKIKKGGEGISTDLLILPRFSNNETNDYDYMEGFPVYLDDSNNRPIVGIININTKISSDLKNIDYLLQTILLHEITHILGFLVGLFKYYPGGEEKTIKYETEKRTNVEKGFIITPKVLAFAKKYFNCDSITGVELERKTKNIIADSHWEARILLGEYMNSELYTPEQVISEFTLALLEDSGWYKANYYTGGLMRFGKNQGCNFLNKDCYNFKAEELRNEFFSLFDAFQPSCSSGRQSRTYFTLKNSESFYLSQYNRNTKYVGKISADYCWVNDLSKEEEEKMLYVGNCQRGGGYYGENVFFKDYNNYNSSFFPKEFGEVYSKNSFCALSSIYPIGKNDEEKNKYYKIFDSIVHSMCYPMFCTNSSLTIQIYDHFVICPRGGGKIEVGGEYTGYLFCPDYNLICTGTVMCNDLFDCVENESLLKDNTYTYDYSNKTYQSISFLQDENVLIDYEKEDDGICPKFCSRCKAHKKCYKCSQNMVLIGKHKNDLKPITCNKTSDLTSRHYLDSEQNVYYECEYGCDSCQNENICLTCSIGFKKNESSKCEEIIENCAKYNKDYTQCIKCKNSTFLIENDKTKCYKDINIEQYYSEDGISYFLCKNEIGNCNKCVNKSFCLECENNYFFKGKDRTKCIRGEDIEKNKYFLEDDGLTYSPCSDILENCNECKNKTYCIKCEDNFTLVIDRYKKRICQNNINKGKYYIEKDEDEILIYHLCSEKLNHCDECINKDNCIKCQDNYFFIGNNRQKCYNETEIEKEKYYSEDNGTTYLSCNLSIKNCDKCINKNYCVKCKDNYFFIGENRENCYKDKENEINIDEYYTEDNGISYYKCDEIIENCNKCINQNNCIKCNNKYYLIGKEKNKCYEENKIDKKKYYIDDDGATLTLCNSTLMNCKECSNKSFCEKCEDNFIFLKNDRKKCINVSEITKNKYYTEDNGTNYYPCNYGINNCDICSNKNYCIKCEENYYFIGDNRTKCYKKKEDNIMEGYYTDDNGTSYHKCNETIKNCYNCLNKTYCIKCEENYYFIGNEKGQCIKKNEIENKKYYLDDSNTTFYLCNNSLKNCNKCSNKSFCEKCQDNTYFIGNDHSQCINDSNIEKDNKYFLNEDSQTYYPCNLNISNCDKCLNSSYCIKCKDEFFFIGENRYECKNEKKELEYYTDDNGTSFYPCDTFIENCEKCLNKSFCIKCKFPYFLLGNNHINCFDLKPEEKNKYYTENNGISYFLCSDAINHCQICNNSQQCIKCEEKFSFINNDKTVCLKEDEIINNTKFFFDENEKIYYSCDINIKNCDKCFGKNNCTKCKDNYYFLGIDRTECINNLELNYFFSEDNGVSYYPCNYSIKNCNECLSKSNCSKCENGYFLIGDDKSHCYNNIENNGNYYTNDNGASFKLCNSSIKNCLKCEDEYTCKECDNNYLLVINNKTMECFSEIKIYKEKEKYYTEDYGKTYFSCDISIRNCDKCINKTYCIECKNNYFFIGENREKCYKDKENEINLEDYYTEDNGISYYKCDQIIENCQKCINKNNCIKCKNGYYLIGDEKNKCYEENKIDKKKYYIDDDGTTLNLCNKSILFCKECESKEECINCMENYFFIGEHRDSCYNKIEEKKYFTIDNGKSYYLCNEEIPHCEECLNESICTKCENNYELSNNFSFCFKSSNILNNCEIISQILSNSYKLNLSLIEQYIDSYILDINTKKNNYIVHHLINNYYNYSILIFKSSICTYSLLKSGYYYINAQNISKELIEFNNFESKEHLFCFINYNQKNNLLIFKQKDKSLIDLNEKYIAFSSAIFNIENNFTSYLINRFGNSILNKIVLNNIDIFNIKEKIFSDLCSSFEIYGIDIPINIRIKEIYLGNEKRKVICKDDSCIFNNKFINNFTGLCQCFINSNSIEYLLNENTSIKNEIKKNTSQIIESFNIFTCIEKGFNKNSYKSNAGFNISLIIIIIQIIFTIFYFIFQKSIKSFDITDFILSNPPKLIILNNNIKENESDNSNEIEQSNQSKDLNFSDYDEDIYIDDENMEKKKRNKNKESSIDIDEEKSDKKLKSEENKKINNYLFKREKNIETNDKEQFSQSSLRAISKLYKEKTESNKNSGYSKNDNKRQILIVKPTEQCLITEENKITISQMKTMEDFMVKPKKKKRSVKNHTLANKLVFNKKHYQSINYKNNIDSNNNILKQITDNQNDKNDKNKLTITSNDINNPIRVRDIILKNRFNKRDSLVSNKKLIINESEEIKEDIKERPKSSMINKKVLKKNRSKGGYKDYIKGKFNTDFKKIEEHSSNNKSMNEKIKKCINVVINKEKIKINTNKICMDFFPLEEVKNKEFRSFLGLYWNILSLRHSIINIFSFVKIFGIMSFTPLTIKIIKIIFMLMLNLFINALILTQDYFTNKFYFFNKKYNIKNIYLENNIPISEKIVYSMNHSLPRILITFIICLIIEIFIEHIFFIERKNYYNFFILKGFNDINITINILMKKIRIKYYIFIFINYLMMIPFFIYIANFSAVYISGYIDFIGAGIWTFILLQIYPFISSLLISILRYYGLKKYNNSCYKLSQFLSF